MRSNFDSLEEQGFGAIAQFGKNAEKYIYTDYNKSITEIGKMAERMTEELMEREGIYMPENENKQFNRIEKLREAGAINENAKSYFHTIRIERNKIAHEDYRANASEAIGILKAGFYLSKSFLKYFNADTRLEMFSMPKSDENESYYEKTVISQGYRPSQNTVSRAQHINNVKKVNAALSQSMQGSELGKEHKSNISGKYTAVKKSALAAFCAIFAMLLILNIYQYISYNHIYEHWGEAEKNEFYSFQEIDWFNSHVVTKENDDNFHKLWCRHNDWSVNFEIVKLDEAAERGYKPCEDCCKD